MARLSVLLILLLIPASASAVELLGRVVGVHDGDTLTLLVGGSQQLKVRLAEIDTPESRQPYGTRARQELSDLAFRRQVRVDVQDTDRYGRTVGRVYAGSIDVNAELVRRGAAWVYRQYARDAGLMPLEEEARAARRGLWALPEAERQAPWLWRVAERRERRRQTPLPAELRSAPLGQSFTCGAKRTCGQMSSCAEAQFYLRQCGLRRLDGDGDGVPCERLCR